MKIQREKLRKRTRVKKSMLSLVYKQVWPVFFLNFDVGWLRRNRYVDTILKPINCHFHQLNFRAIIRMLIASGLPTQINVFEHLMQFIKHPHALTVLEDTLYWTDREGMSVSSCNKWNGKDGQSVVMTGLDSPNDIHAFNPVRQPNGEFYAFETIS